MFGKQAPSFENLLNCNSNLSNILNKSQERRDYNYNFDADISRAELMLSICTFAAFIDFKKATIE